MEIRTVEFILTPENLADLMQMRKKHREDCRTSNYFDVKDEIEFRTWFTRTCLNIDKKARQRLDGIHRVIDTVKKVRRSNPETEILPIGPFQAYGLKGKYGNPDRPEIEGFAIVFEPKDEHTT